MQLGEWQINIVSGGRFLHDGGILYGVVPKAIWQSITPANSQNLVPLAMNCLLVRNSAYNLLIDTGHGDKLSPLDRKAHGVDSDWPLPNHLARLGLTLADIDGVVLSHLHWDHAGGATTKSHGNLIPSCPNATYYVHRQEWQDANSGAPEFAGGYHSENFLPLAEHNRLVLVDHLQEIVPGIRIVQTGGHTLGHVAVTVESQGAGVIYLGDIAPTIAHVRRMWCTAYDLDLRQTRKVKAELFAYAADQRLWVVWNHDCQTPISRIARHSQREFVVAESAPTHLL